MNEFTSFLLHLLIVCYKRNYIKLKSYPKNQVTGQWWNHAHDRKTQSYCPTFRPKFLGKFLGWYIVTVTIFAYSPVGKKLIPIQLPDYLWCDFHGWYFIANKFIMMVIIWTSHFTVSLIIGKVQNYRLSFFGIRINQFVPSLLGRSGSPYDVSRIARYQPGINN